MRPRATLEEDLRPLIAELDTETAIDFDALVQTLLEGVVFLQDSETLLILAIERSQGARPSCTAPKSGSAQFGHAANRHPTDALIVDFQRALAEVFGRDAGTVERILVVLGKVTIPRLTPEQWNYLHAHLDKGDIVAGDGSIIGEGKYEELDVKWSYAFGNYLLNLLDPNTIAPFEPVAGRSKHRPAGPYGGSIGESESVIRIAVIGDWGTGSYDASPGYDPARLVMQTVQNLDPDYLIHLGDFYYAGTDLRYPPDEEIQNFLDPWSDELRGHSFTLNPNHEMYGGAQGYFGKALNREDVAASPFSMQNGYSFFPLEFGPWLLVGIDAAYHDTSFLYMHGGIGSAAGAADDEQIRFLQGLARQYQNKKIIAFTHQTAMSTDGTTIEHDGKVLYPLLDQLWQTGLTPDYWYWGHVHLGIVYGNESAVTQATGGKTKARCVGHSAVPFAAPWALAEGDGVIDYIANTKLQSSPLALNGLALLTLGRDGTIEEQLYDCADPQGRARPDPQPIWSR